LIASAFGCRAHRRVVRLEITVTARVERSAAKNGALDPTATRVVR
jgi:hypothetical protein